MHLNRLSTSAMMRLSVLAALNMVVARMVDRSVVLFHPVVFLSVVTIDLGLYAVMVYSGTLNRTLIAMMLAGLAGVLASIAFGGLGPSTFTYGSSYEGLARIVEALIDRSLKLWAIVRGDGLSTRFGFDWKDRPRVGYLVADVLGAITIVIAGLLARVVRVRSRQKAADDATSAS